MTVIAGGHVRAAAVCPAAAAAARRREPRAEIRARNDAPDPLPRVRGAARTASVGIPIPGADRRIQPLVSVRALVVMLGAVRARVIDDVAHVVRLGGAPIRIGAS